MMTKEQTMQKVRGSSDVSYLGESIDTMVSEFMREEEIDGLTLAIVQAPYIPRVAGYGMSDRLEKRLASMHTMWPIGPISQAFTAVAIMQLQEENKLHVSHVIAQYLPELPTSWQKITILDLLHHASGICDYRDATAYNQAHVWTFSQLMNLIKDEQLHFVPGTAVEQSATNFLLLSEIIERVSNLSYHDFIWKNQITYLGLKHTGFVEDLDSFAHEDVSLENHVHQIFKVDRLYIDPVEPAVSYTERNEKIHFASTNALRGYADLWASAQDVSFWDIALAGAVLIHDPANRALIYVPWYLPNGEELPAVAGWQFYKHRGFMDHKGSIPGYSSFLSRFTDPNELVCVTLLANKEHVDFTNLGRRIAAAFGDAMSTNANDLEQYVYESQFSVAKTIMRLEKALQKRDIDIFAKFDHMANAKGVHLDMRPSTVLVFGSPKVGTMLMQDDPSIAIELPLKIAVWEDANGSVWLSFAKVMQYAERYHITHMEILHNMQKLLEALVAEAGSVYERR